MMSQKSGHAPTNYFQRKQRADSKTPLSEPFNYSAGGKSRAGLIFFKNAPTIKNEQKRLFVFLRQRVVSIFSVEQLRVSGYA